MKVVNYSEIRKNFKSFLDRVNEDADYTVINRRNGEDAVLMSLNSFNSLMETVHLLRSPANAEHLIRSIEQYHNGRTAQKDLIGE